MEIIISSVEQQQLIKQSRLKDLATNDYLKDIYNENLKEIARLFFDNDINRALQLNVWSNIFMTITDIYSFFIWQPTMDLDFDISDLSKDLISVWKAVVWLWYNEDNQYVMEYIPATNYIFSNNEHKVIRYYSSINDNQRKFYILKQIYRVWSIENTLYEVSNLEATNWNKVPLNTIPQTAWLKDIYNTWLDRVSLFIATDEDVVYWSNQSLIEKIKQLWYSLDRKSVMFEKQFLQDVDQYKIFNNLNLQKYIDNEGRFNTTQVWKVLVNSEWMEWDVKFIWNQNPLIKDAIEYEQTQLKKISSSTFIPLDFLWLNTTGTTSWSSRMIMISAFIKSIQNRQQILQRQILLPILKILEEKRQKVNWEIITTNIFWEDVIPRDSKEIADELKVARETGLISQYNAIKSYMWYNTDDQVNEELNLLKKENETNNWSESKSNNETTWE